MRTVIELNLIRSFSFSCGDARVADALPTVCLSKRRKQTTSRVHMRTRGGVRTICDVYNLTHGLASVRRSGEFTQLRLRTIIDVLSVINSVKSYT